ncbi:MAG: hypothetical protein Q9M40_07225 [Sulfurimonas sp.]|nr:hypothetical protein [Sulfurimonas sp.]
MKKNVGDIETQGEEIIQQGVSAVLWNIVKDIQIIQENMSEVLKHKAGGK